MMKPFFIGLVMICLISSCNLTTKNEKLISTEKNPTGKTVRLYYVEGGATAKDVIQIRKVTDGNHEVLIKAYEHNMVKDVKFTSTDSLSLVLADTTSFGMSKKPDTLKIKI